MFYNSFRFTVTNPDHLLLIDKQNNMRKLFNQLKKLKAEEVLPFLIEKSKNNPTFGIVLIAISALMIFTAGKSFGRFLYLILN
ncbi:hypothetical protein BBI01_07010 [Chryseobacterium artocarpi]|uniref:Uncharacterized protein n=2 Tax=Chryseobacterium artocarpi TaxID=1414727 RepID=A0A1B8ZXW5_9FLAO|nr:hypothetical protein BBI01_07010 [Chryseobacterium artocarpi]